LCVVRIAPGSRENRRLVEPQYSYPHAGHPLTYLARRISRPRETVLSPQGVPQTGQQGVITGVGKIAIAQGKRSGFAPCASANQQGLPAPTGFKYQSDFGGSLVRAIHDKVGVGRNHLLHAFWRDEIIDAVHTTSRIDV